MSTHTLLSLLPESIKPSTRLGSHLCLPHWDGIRLGMKESEHGYSSFDSVVVFSLCVAYSGVIHRTVASADNEEVIVTIVNNASNKRPLRLIACWKKLHASRHTIQLKQSLYDLLTFFLQVPEG